MSVYFLEEFETILYWQVKNFDPFSGSKTQSNKKFQNSLSIGMKELTIAVLTLSWDIFEPVINWHEQVTMITT